jgi:hypothetical protein
MTAAVRLEPATTGTAPASRDDDMAAHVRELVDTAPPLSASQRDRLALLLHPRSSA